MHKLYIIRRLSTQVPRCSQHKQHNCQWFLSILMRRGFCLLRCAVECRWNVFHQNLLSPLLLLLLVSFIGYEPVLINQRESETSCLMLSYLFATCYTTRYTHYHVLCGSGYTTRILKQEENPSWDRYCKTCSAITNVEDVEDLRLCCTT